MKTQTYNIKGMHCTGCATLIQMEVEEMSGVEKIEVDQDTSQASVTFSEEPVSLEVLNAALKSHGYELTEK